MLNVARHLRKTQPLFVQLRCASGNAKWGDFEVEWGDAESSPPSRQQDKDTPDEEGAGSVNIYTYPPSKFNTILNICPQGTRMVVERLGKYKTIEEPGWFMAIPFVDRVCAVQDLRELTIRVCPRVATTKDNVSVTIGGNLFLTVEDPYAATYAVRRPLYAVTQHAQSAMRTGIGQMELDDVFQDRAKLNDWIFRSMQEASTKWGIRVNRYEVTDLDPPKKIRETMELQAAAERKRRETVKSAEAEREACILASEGIRIKLENEAQGNATAVTREAEAKAAAVRMEYEALSASLAQLGDVLKHETGETAMKRDLASAYIQAFGKLAQNPNQKTVFLPEHVGDVSSMVARSMGVFDAMKTSPQVVEE